MKSQAALPLIDSNKSLAMSIVYRLVADDLVGESEGAHLHKHFEHFEMAELLPRDLHYAERTFLNRLG